MCPLFSLCLCVTAAAACSPVCEQPLLYYLTIGLPWPFSLPDLLVKVTLVDKFKKYGEETEIAVIAEKKT